VERFGPLLPARGDDPESKADPYEAAHRRFAIFCINPMPMDLIIFFKQ